MIVEGGHRLEGEVAVSGSKNSALPILVATLLTRDECVIHNVPYLDDVDTIMEILRCLGVDITRREDGAVVSRVSNEDSVMAPYELVRKMRASVCVLGPLLARRKKARVSLPGGCVIGVRPIDLHLKGFAALGANIRIEHGYVEAESKELRGAEIFLGGPFGSSVLGTANVMTAAVLAQGTTVIEQAACEPEVQDLAHFLMQMGARISGAGTHHLVIEGVSELHGAEYTIIPDRIEAGTWMAAAAITQGDVVVRECRLDHLSAVIDKLKEIGVELQKGDKDRIRVIGRRRLRAAEITTFPYPGFPTDLQAQFLALSCLAEGISVVTEKIYPDRFMHVAELNRMGAKIHKEGPTAIIEGVDFLSGAPVMASDLRASAALVLAGLVARGSTAIDRIYHLDRGYEGLEEKLRQLGARVRRAQGQEKSE